MAGPRPEGGRDRRVLIGTDLVALSLGVSRRHVQHLVQRGVLTNHGTARCVLIDLDEAHDTMAGMVA